MDQKDFSAGKPAHSEEAGLPREPRISLNKLAEYMNANPVRRRQIVKDAKAPMNFIVTRYSDARSISRNYIAAHGEVEVITRGVENLEKKRTASDFQKDDKHNSLRAVEFLRAMELPDLTTYAIRAFEEGGASLVIGGVLVSVQPDLLLYTTNGDICGAVKLHLSKSNILMEEGMKTVATVLRNYLEGLGCSTQNSACISIDIFAAKYATAPSAYKQTMKRVEAACLEIQLHWGDV